MMLRLFQLLEGRDFWLDNFVACGEFPVPIDLETLCQPRKHFTSSDSETFMDAFREIEDSALPIGILSLKSLIGPGLRATEMGALCTRPFLSTPLRTISWFDALVPFNHRIKSEDGFLTIHEKISGVFKDDKCC